MKNKNFRYIISLLIPDKIGILKNITSIVADSGGNIDGMSQTIVHGYFTVVLTATFKKSIEINILQKEIKKQFYNEEISIIIKEYNPIDPIQSPIKRDLYILTLSGRDRPGILKRLTAFFAEKKINIEDYYFKINKGNVIHIGEITIPYLLDIKQIQDELQSFLSPLNLTVNLQHENIFKATTEVNSIKLLFKEIEYA